MSKTLKIMKLSNDCFKIHTGIRADPIKPCHIINILCPLQIIYLEYGFITYAWEVMSITTLYMYVYTVYAKHSVGILIIYGAV